MRLVKTKQRSANNKLCPRRVPPGQEKNKQQQQQQQKPQSNRCHRRLQSCLARASSVAGECLSANTKDFAGSSKPQHMSLNLENELPTILAADPRVIRTKMDTRRRRGYRIFYRPVNSKTNYYSVPFPPPESLRLECDGDERFWQDMEVRVISHAGVVVWQNMLTLSDEPKSCFKTNALAQHSVHRKFSPRAYGMSQSAINKRKAPRKAQLQNPSSAMLSIEATINHGMCDIPAPEPAQPPPLGAPLRVTTAQQMFDATTVSHSNAMGAASARGNLKPLCLINQLRQMQQLNLKEIKQAHLQAQQQQLQQQLNQATKLPSQRLVQLQPGAKVPGKGTKYPLCKDSVPSKIPRLKSNWYQQKKSLGQSGSVELPEEEMQRLRRMLLKKLRNFHRQSPVDASSGHQISCACRTSYMRPYSPVLHYPTPSLLPIPINRGARRTGGGRVSQ